MSKFILISVCNRDILTEQFDTYEAARKQMLTELLEWGRIDVPDEIPAAALLGNEYTAEDDTFGFWKYGGYANTSKSELDWSIVEIPMEEKK